MSTIKNSYPLKWTEHGGIHNLWQLRSCNIGSLAMYVYITAQNRTKTENL